MNKIMKKYFTTICALSSVGAGSVIAQEQLTLEEVMVTAQKREQSLQDVPIAVTAVTAEQMEASGVRSFENLSQSIPGVVINAQNSLVLPFIRGVGSFNANAATPSSVAIYVDGVYTPRSNSLSFALDNVAQIEVLKGPQSTLYGRNATGGAITITTLTPTPDEELNGKFKLTYGNYNQRRANFHISGGLSDTLAASFTGAIIKTDGIYDNLSSVTSVFAGTPFAQTRGKEVGDEDEQAFTAKIAFTPSEKTEFVLSASYRSAEDDRHFAVQQFNGANFITAAIGGPLAAAGVPQPIVDAQVNGLISLLPTEERELYTHFGFRDAEDTTVKLSANIDFGNMYLVSLTGWANNKLTASTESFSIPIPLAGFAPIWDTTAISQELRLHSNSDSALQWLVGADYFKEGDDRSRLFGVSANDPVTGAPVPPFLAITANNALADTDWDAESTALFAEVVYAASEQANITVGIRNTWEEFNTSDNRDPAFYAAIGIPGVPVPDRSVDTEEFTYRLVFDYNFDWGLVYLSRAQGFVSGSLNVQNPAGDFVEPEQLIAHEVGFKADLMEGRLRLNGALFDYDYEDIHSQTVNAATGGTNLVAGQEAAVQGLDLELTAALTQELTLTGGITHLFKREYGLFSVPANPAGGFPAIEASGNTIAGAPENSIVLNLMHEMELSQGSLSTSLNINYNGGFFFDSLERVGSGATDDSEYTVVNLSTTYRSADEHWSVALYVNNLTDEYYLTSGLSPTGGSTDFEAVIGIESAPRMYGVTVGYSF